MINFAAAPRVRLPPNVILPGLFPGLRSPSRKTSPEPVVPLAPESEPKNTADDPAEICICPLLMMSS